MRVRVVGLFLLAACDDPSAPSPAPAPVAAAAPVVAPWTSIPPQDSTEGGEPRAVVRLGQQSTPMRLVISSTFSTTASRGLTVTDPARIDQSRTIDITPSASGRRTFVVSAASDTGTGGAPVDPEVAAALVGRTGEFTSTDRCDVSSAGIETPAGPAARHTPGLLRTIVELCPMLPEIPMGLGGTWSTTETRAGGSVWQTEWTHAGWEGTHAVLTFNARATSGEEEGYAEGRVELTADSPTVIRYDARGHSIRTRNDPSGEAVRWDTNWEMHVDSSPLTTP